MLLDDQRRPVSHYTRARIKERERETRMSSEQAKLTVSVSDGGEQSLSLEPKTASVSQLPTIHVDTTTLSINQVFEAHRKQIERQLKDYAELFTQSDQFEQRAIEEIDALMAMLFEYESQLKGKLDCYREHITKLSQMFTRFQDENNNNSLQLQQRQQ